MRDELQSLRTSPLRTVLPRGLYDADGVCHRVAWLRPLTGADELGLAGLAGAASPTTETVLLASCVRRLGDFEPVDATHVAALSRGDRAHLLLRLRAAMFGDRIFVVVRCENPVCGEQSDVILKISELSPEPDGPEPGPEFILVETPDGTATVREPTGDDDAEFESASALWSRLVVDLDGPMTPARWAELSTPTRHAIALGLAEQTSAPDLAIVAPCASCGAWLEIEISPVALLARELGVGADRLFAEVHCIAFHYGWSEREILALPRERRWRYLELLKRQLDGRPLETWRG